MDEKVLTALSLFIIALVSLLTRSVNSYIDKVKHEKEETADLQRKYAKEQIDRLNSIKRSMLRSEYLTIYHSGDFTYNEKYIMTRKIISDYQKLKGNTYIKELDAKLSAKVIMSDNEGNLYYGERDGD
nr:MAG TPA: hypothetical protein [Caudoviricetes sp.]